MTAVDEQASVPDDGDLAEAARRVIGEVRGLRADLAKKAEKQSVRRTWRVLAFDVVLSLVGLGLWYSQVQTNDRLEESLRQNYTTAQQQQVTRVRVLCPLYEVLLTAAANPNPQVATTVEQKARLAAALATIQSGYRTLGCTPALPSAGP